MIERRCLRLKKKSYTLYENDVLLSNANFHERFVKCFSFDNALTIACSL